MSNEKQVAIRLPADFLSRAQRLMPKLGKRPELRAWGGKVTRSNVLRLAILRGLEELERETSE